MGIDIIRPTNNSKSKSEYVIIFRFNKYDNFEKWEKSTIRNEWLQKGRELAESDYDVQKLTGLEFWFTPYFKEESSSMIRFKPSTSVQNGNCYYSSYFHSAPDFSSSNSFFNRNAIDSLCNKTCYRYYDNSSANDLCDNASFNKIIKILVIQVLAKI